MHHESINSTVPAADDGLLSSWWRMRIVPWHWRNGENSSDADAVCKPQGR